MNDTLLSLGRAAERENPYSFDPQKSAWLSGVLSAVWGGAPGDDMPGSFNQGYHWSQRWLSENRPEQPVDPSPWQTGNPPESGCYLVTQEFSGGTGVFMMEWDGDDWLEYSSVEGPLYAASDNTEILAWQSLPEPYRGQSHES